MAVIIGGGPKYRRHCKEKEVIMSDVYYCKCGNVKVSSLLTSRHTAHENLHIARYTGGRWALLLDHVS